jgi:GT2 family glycosyltransferase
VTEVARPRPIALAPAAAAPRLFGVLVTYHRPEDLAETLDRIRRQTCQLAYLVVVDNGPSPESERAVRDFVAAGGPAEYLPSEDNLGPAGGLSAGMARVLEVAGDDDWMVLLDDDDPPYADSVLDAILRFARSQVAEDGRTAAVGLAGARFDWRSARLLRPRDEELTGPVEVDYIGGNQLPTYRVAVVRDLGTFRADLFFGYDDLEFGLRLRSAGYRLCADGQQWRELRSRRGRLGLSVMPARAYRQPDWREYYAVRNILVLLRRHRRYAAAVRVTLISGLAKPLAQKPLPAGPYLRRVGVMLRACMDGWCDNMGRRVAPVAKSVPSRPSETER